MIDFPDDQPIAFPDLAPFLLGMVHRYGAPSVLCYDQDAILDQFAKDMGSYEDAVEYFEFNVIGGYYGPLTPVFLSRRELELLEDAPE